MKDLRNRINKKINKNYNQRQKILNEIKQILDIDFYKISIYFSVIEIHFRSSDPSTESTVDSQNKKEKSNENEVELPNNTQEKKSLFRIDLSHSMSGSQRFFYKNKDINNLSIEELNNLKRDLGFILREIDKEIDKLLV